MEYLIVHANEVMMVVGALILTAAISAMLGYARKEQQFYDMERTVLNSNNDMRDKLQVAYDLLDEEVKWKNAIFNMLVIYHIGDKDAWNDPEVAIAKLMQLEGQMALDPSISKGANQLINKAKREHGKKIRKAADRKLERAERDCDARINSMQITVDLWKKDAMDAREGVALLRAEFSAYQSAIVLCIDKYMPLQSVRAAFINTLNAEHQKFKDL